MNSDKNGPNPRYDPVTSLTGSLSSPAAATTHRDAASGDRVRRASVLRRNQNVLTRDGRAPGRRELTDIDGSVDALRQTVGR